MKLKRLSKQLLVIVLSLAVLASTLMLQTFTTLADGVATGSWEGEEEAFAEGDGSAGNPYRIANAKQLAMLGKYVKDNNTAYNAADKHYILTSDISLNDTTDMGDTPWYERTDTNIKAWTYGVGSSAGRFKGYLDGNGYVISGLYAYTDQICAGLFAGASGTAVIKNLGIEASYLHSTYMQPTSNSEVAAFAARITDGNVVFENCYVDDSVVLYGGKVAGFVSELSGNTTVKVSNCYSNPVLQLSREGGLKGTFAAGIGGDNKLIMKKCYSVSSISFVGYGFAKQTYEDCYAVTGTAAGITKVKLKNILGIFAKDNMPAFNFTHKWITRDGDTPQLKVFTHPQELANPTLENKLTTVGLTKKTMALVWPEAVDDVTAPEDMVYTVYMSQSPITDSALAGLTPYAVKTGATNVTVDGLVEGDNYYFAVVANDEAGKKSALVTIAQPYTHTFSTVDDWDGTVADGLTVGSGTVNEPYVIVSAEQLAYLAELCKNGDGLATRDKYYRLNVDINLNDVSNSNWMKNSPKEWTVGTAPILEESSFLGIFDGNGHVINGLYIGDGAEQYNGLFPSLAGGAVVKNLGITNSCIESEASGYFGLVAGYVATSATNNVRIESSYVGSNTAVTGEYAGGFVGSVLSTITVENCYSSAVVTGTVGAGSFIGGMAYPNISVTVNSCYSTVDTPLVALTAKHAKVNYSTSYTVGASAEGLATVTLAHMTGLDAKKYMKALDFASKWATKENATPIPAAFVPKTDYSAIKWSGQAAAGYADGDGLTEATAYIIETAEQLALLGKTVAENPSAVSGKYFKLAKDIILNDISDADDGTKWYARTDTNLQQWTYGATGKAFRGTLDGDGHIIKGLYIDSSTNRYMGLFSKLSGSAAIKNLGVEDSYINNTYLRPSDSVGIGDTGVFAGVINNAADTNVTIENCYVADTVTVISNEYAGGFIGDGTVDVGRKVNIKNCYSSASLTSTQGKSKGAFVAFYYATHAGLNLKNCYSTQSGIQLVNGYSWPQLQSPSTEFDSLFVNCYSLQNQTFTSKDSGGNNVPNKTFSGLTVLAAADMLGENARTKMPNLDYDSDWIITAGKTPGLRKFYRPIGGTDNAAPAFTGTITAAETTKISITVTWPEAIDDFTPNAYISYSVYASENPITRSDIGSAALLGAFSIDSYNRKATFIDLDSNKSYYFAVCAADERENKSYIYSTEAIKPKASVNGIWQGGVAGYYESGDGSAANPFVIANAEQLAYFVKNATKATTEGVYFAISNDITLNDVSDSNWKKNSPNEWIYGNSAINGSDFYGTLDGGGHVVKGLYVDGYGERVGLVSKVTDHAIIKRLGVINSYLNVENTRSGVAGYVGAITGSASSANVVKNDDTKQGIRFIECFVDETVEVIATAGSGNRVFSAGMSGGVSQGNGNDEAKKKKTAFIDCYAGAQVYGDYSFSFVGDVYADTETLVFERCFSHDLNLKFSHNWYKGALKFVDCYTAGEPISGYEGNTHVNIVDMMGKDANKTLNKLDFNTTWVTTSSASPVLKAFTVGRTAAEYEPFALDRQPVTVSFAVGGGVEVEPLVGLVGQKLTLPTTTREGFVFEGWYLYAADSPLAYPIDYFPAYDITLFAKWRDLATLRIDFESYPYRDAGEDGLGEDHEWFRPGVTGYNADYVHGGGRSLHRIGELDTEQSFQLFDLDSNKLEVGKKYELTMWVYADKVTSGKIMLESSDRLKISKKSTVIADIADVTALKQGEWQEVKITFTAQNPYVLIRTSGSNSLYFDDVTIYEKGVGDLINTGTDTGNKTEGSEIGSTGESNAIVICFVVFAVSALMMAVVLLLKKKRG